MNKYYKDIGKRIRELRQKNNISQKLLAEKICLTEAHISKIENGKTMLSVQSLIDITNALETTTDYILFDNVIKLKVLLNKEIEELLKDLTQEQLKIIIEMIKASKNAIKMAADEETKKYTNKKKK